MGTEIKPVLILHKVKNACNKNDINSIQCPILFKKGEIMALMFLREMMNTIFPL